jgi:hypothetical protein
MNENVESPGIAGGTLLAVTPPMNAVIQTLLKLQALEFADVADPSSESQIKEYRTQVPPQILAHYDRLRVRGKKGVAIVRNKTCTGCHMQQPIGKITVLMRNEDIQLCDSCGRYMYLPTETETAFVEQVIASKPAAKTPRPRKRKVVPAVA